MWDSGQEVSAARRPKRLPRSGFFAATPSFWKIDSISESSWFNEALLQQGAVEVLCEIEFNW